ncbi:DUF2813 domain-containing protein [Cystobacter fuscus]
MLTSLRVTGFRNFSSLSMEGLTRVNLLVGENNAGKTSVLEAAEILLLARTVPLALARGPMRRGESIPPRLDSERDYGESIDLAHLFKGRKTSLGNRFEIHGETPGGIVSIACTLEQTPSKPRGVNTAVESPARIALEVEPKARVNRIPLELSGMALNRRSRPYPPSEELETPALQFVGTASPDTDSLGAMWDEIVLTPEEKKVIEALQIVQPDIERIAWLSYFAGGQAEFS